ncbi:hypothetical protein Tco_1415750 [Tanacetum coccineum]
MTSIPTFMATRLHQLWRAILSVLNRCLTGKDTSWDRARLLNAVDRTSRPIKQSKLIYTRFTKLIIDHFLSINKIIPRSFDATLYGEGQDYPISKLIDTVDGKFKFRMEIPYTMINDAIKQSAEYKFYKMKKDESEQGIAEEEPEEQHVSPIRSGRGKRYMCIGNQEVNVSSKPKKAVVTKKLRTLTVVDNILIIEKQVEKDVEEGYATERGLKLKGVATKDPALDLEYSSITSHKSYQSLLHLLSKVVYTDTHTTLAVANQEGNPEEMFLDDADHQESSSPAITTHDLKLEALTSINVPKAIEEVVQAKKNQINLFTTPSTTIAADLSKMDVKLQLLNKIIYGCPRHIAIFQEKASRPSRSPNDRKGEKIKKRRKDAGEPSSRSSKTNKAPIDSIREDTHADQPQDQEEELVVAKKIKELIKKDELTVTDLEGVGLEMLKRQYKNDVELECHVEQLKAAVLEEA